MKKMMKPLIYRTVLLMLLSALATGCSFFGDSKKLPPLTDIANSAIAIEWSTSAGNPNRYLFTPGLGDKTIYATAYNGTINVLADEGGKNVSRIDTKAKLTGGVGVGEETVVVANTKGDVMAFDAAGRTLWTTPLAGEILAAPLVNKGTVIVRTADGRMFALNRADGKRKWVFNRSAPPLTLRTNASATINAGVIYAGYPGGKIVAIELENGRPVWEATISLPRGTTELERIADVAGLPIVDDSRVCAAVYQGRTGCVESLSGNVLWTRDISSADGVAVGVKNLFVSDTDGNLSALDKSSGATVWKQDKLQRRDLGTPAIVKGRVLVGDRLGFIHAISPDTGDMIGRVATDGSRVISLLSANDRAIVQTEKGGIFAIAVK
jgi:outer membrane protein assembly factor BamB